MIGKLYIVATPIGNLEDITLRALRVLKEVDLIAAEDTRQTLKLLNHYEINKPLISYHRHNEETKSEILIEKLRNGENIALVSDAGTPGICDPGEEVIKKAIEDNIEVTYLHFGLHTNLDKLEALENKLIELKKAEDNQDKANVVIELINKLPAANELTLEGEDKVKEARTSYEALSEEVKALVTNLGKLEALEDKMKDLIEDKKLHDEATMVVAAIDNLPNVELITLDAESAIVNARNAYNSLAPKAKALVTNLNKLIALENKIKELKGAKENQTKADAIINLIDKLPALDKLTLDDEEEVVKVRNAYMKK